MTFEKLEKIIEENHIPHNVRFMSDSGWECDATQMDGVFYNKEKNMIVFTQSGNEHDAYYSDPSWKIIGGCLFDGNINKCISCDGNIDLRPLGEFFSIDDRFIEELKKAGEFEEYYGIKESEDKYFDIHLRRPLFYEIVTDREEIGYIGFNIHDDSCELEIYVFREHRNKGYGTTALKALLDKLKQKELLVFNRKTMAKEVYSTDRITASVRVENDAANALVKACGFQDKGRAAMTFVSVDDGNDLEDWVDVNEYEISLRFSTEEIQIIDDYATSLKAMCEEEKRERLREIEEIHFDGKEDVIAGMDEWEREHGVSLFDGLVPTDN